MKSKVMAFSNHGRWLLCVVPKRERISGGRSRSRGITMTTTSLLSNFSEVAQIRTKFAPHVEIRYISTGRPRDASRTSTAAASASSNGRSFTATDEATMTMTTVATTLSLPLASLEDECS
jgi:hypothetical protein